MQIQVSLIKKGTLEKIEGTKLWKLASPYIWEIYVHGVRHVITVPEGFITDFGSIPRILWFVFNPTEYNTYILHDYLYQYTLFPRSKDDLALQIGLLGEGCDSLSSLFIYSGVRVGGWLYFNKHKNKNGCK